MILSQGECWMLGNVECWAILNVGQCWMLGNVECWAMLNWVHFCGIHQMTALILWLHAVWGCNHQSIACSSFTLYFGLLQYHNLATVKNLQPERFMKKLLLNKFVNFILPIFYIPFIWCFFATLEPKTCKSFQFLHKLVVTILLVLDYFWFWICSLDF